MSEDFKVQVSLKDAQGKHMLNVRGAGPQEVRDILVNIYGAGADDAILGLFHTVSDAPMSPEQVAQSLGAEVVQQPAAAPAQAAPPQQQAPAPQPQPQAQPAQQGPGPVCEKCGANKNWVPPGFSQRTQKSYPGFYSCPNRCPK